MTYAMLGDFLAAAAPAPTPRPWSIVSRRAGCVLRGHRSRRPGDDPRRVTRAAWHGPRTHRWWPLVQCPKPTICAVDGPAVGMGAEFTSQCDLRLACPSARFGWNFVHRGLVPDTGAGTWLLPRIVGLQQALDCCTRGDHRRRRGVRLGYVLDVVERRVLPAGDELADADRRRVAAQPRPDQGAGLRGPRPRRSASTWSATPRRWPRASERRPREGVASFLERRPAPSPATERLC